MSPNFTNQPMDSNLQNLKAQLESEFPELSFVVGGYLRYRVRQTTIQVALSEPRKADIFEEFILKSALALTPAPTEAEIAEMLGIDSMFVRHTTARLQASSNLEVGSESGITVKPATQELFQGNQCILQPKSTQKVYAIEDFLTGEIFIQRKPVNSAPLALKNLDTLIDNSSDSADDDNNQTSQLDMASIELLLNPNNSYVTKYQEIETKPVDVTFKLLVLQNTKNTNHIIQAFFGDRALPKISDWLTNRITEEKFNREQLAELLSPTILPDEIASVMHSTPKILIQQDTAIGNQRVYIGLPHHLAERVLWVKRNYRTNPLSHIPGGYDVVVEYHNGRALGYDWIKKPWIYIRTFFSGIIECEYDEFENLEQDIQMRIIQDNIRSLYSKFYPEENQRRFAKFEKVWDSNTANELPWLSLKRFAENHSHNRGLSILNKSISSPQINVFDYYGYEPDYEDPTEKAERLWGIPDPRLVED